MLQCIGTEFRFQVIVPRHSADSFRNLESITEHSHVSRCLGNEYELPCPVSGTISFLRVHRVLRTCPPCPMTRSCRAAPRPPVETPVRIELSTYCDRGSLPRPGAPQPSTSASTQYKRPNQSYRRREKKRQRKAQLALTLVSGVVPNQVKPSSGVAPVPETSATPTSILFAPLTLSQ